MRVRAITNLKLVAEKRVPAVTGTKGVVLAMEKWLAFFLFSFPFFLERKKRDLGRWRANVSRAVWACVASCTLDISGWNGVPLFFSTRSSRGIGGGEGPTYGRPADQPSYSFFRLAYVF